MGRTQVSQSVRSQVLHSAPTNPKLQQKQQQQQPLRPTSAYKAQTNAQVYRPTPVTEHPDDAFLTGAWMFDQSRIPQWMQSQLPKAYNTSTKTAKAPAQQRATTPNTRTVSPKHMQSIPTAQPKPIMSYKAQPTRSMGQQQLKQSLSSASKHKVIRPTPVYEHPDTAFLSGAWLFDSARTPLWMQREVPALATAMVVRSRRLASALPVSRANRPHSTKHYFNVNWTGFKAFGATPYAVIPLGSVRARNAHPDDAFYSGAWIFDAKCAPSWLAQELKLGSTTKHSQAQTIHMQKQRTNHMQYAGVKLANGRKLAGV